MVTLEAAEAGGADEAAPPAQRSPRPRPATAARGGAARAGRSALPRRAGRSQLARPAAARAGPGRGSACPVEVKVPSIGDFKDVPIIEVLVKPGDAMARDASLVMLESEKATMDVPSPDAGTVREVRVKVGDQVSEGSARRGPRAHRGAGARRKRPPPPAPGVAAPAPPPPARRPLRPRSRRLPPRRARPRGDGRATRVPTPARHPPARARAGRRPRPRAGSGPRAASSATTFSGS